MGKLRSKGEMAWPRSQLAEDCLTLPLPHFGTPTASICPPTPILPACHTSSVSRLGKSWTQRPGTDPENGSPHWQESVNKPRGHCLCCFCCNHVCLGLDCSLVPKLHPELPCLPLCHCLRIPLEAIQTPVSPQRPSGIIRRNK